jgi:hypothetical protein
MGLDKGDLVSAGAYRLMRTVYQLGGMSMLPVLAAAELAD